MGVGCGHGERYQIGDGVREIGEELVLQLWNEGHDWTGRVAVVIFDTG